jgi:ABC-2 type transport system ATP-binding protein
VTGADAQRIVAVLARSGVPFAEVTSQRATLEDVYLRLTAGESEYRAVLDQEQGR